MDSRRAQQGTKRMSARYQAVTEEEMLNEGEYDDKWPSRQPSSTRRYQGLADVRTETGRVADVQLQPGRRSYVNPAGERHTIPPRRTATQGRIPVVQTASPARVYIDEENTRAKTTEDYRTVSPRGKRRFHWSVFVGLALLIMIFGWIALGALGTWWQTTTDDWHYGRPRTFQIDQVVGHHDSLQNPSHFIAMNLNRHVVIIEIPGGDVSKSVVFSGPTLLGPGQDLAPVTLTFQDVNHDGKLDMIVNVQGSQFVFLNENGTFVSPSQNQNGAG
jgi:hypothetical protein